MQLSIFQQDRINQLLQSLNEDLKPSEKYIITFIIEVNKISVFGAINKEKDVLFNTLDKYGQTPKNHSSCWRVWEHIKHEIH